MERTAEDAVVAYLVKRGESDSLTIGRALGREFGWKTILDAENAVKNVDGVCFRIVDGAPLWSYDYKRARRYLSRLPN